METVKLTINGREVAAPKGELLIEACEMHGEYLPRFCHFRGLTPQASCRMCVVRVDNPKIPKLQTACTMPVTDGMVVTTNSEEIETTRKAMIEFLLANHPVDCPVCDRAGECELQDQTYGFGEDRTRSQYSDKDNYLERQISPFIYNDPQRCVTCKRCTRVCEEWMDENAITVLNRGAATIISSFGGWVECSDCGNCVDVCPTGTLLHVPYKYVARPWDLKQVPTVCNFCSDGCSMLAGTRSEQLVRTVARDGRGRTAGGINHDFLCSLGRYTIDTVHSKQRLERPLIRRGHRLIPTTWDEALNYVAEKLGAVKAKHGGDALGVISSARLLNEDQFVLRRFATDVLETKNADFYHDHDEVDLAGFFAHGVPTIATQEQLQNAEVIVLIGSDPNEENPLTAFSLRWAVRQNAARLFTVNAMPSRLERQANIALRIRKGSESAFVQALLDGGKVDDAAQALGVAADALTTVRQAIADAGKVVIVFGDELRGAALRSLTLLETTLPASAERAAAARAAFIDALQRQVRSTNSTQKPAINDNPHTYIVEHPTLEVGTETTMPATKFSFLPLVRYSNTMGATQMGLTAQTLGGQTAHEMLQAAGEGIKALFIAGEDVLAKAEGQAAVLAARLDDLELLVVQDMFLTETAQVADVVFPVTSFAESQGTQVNNGSQVQFLRRVIPPVGQARPDWMVINSLAKLLGVDFGFSGQIKNVFRAISETVPGYAGLSHNQLANEGATQVQFTQTNAAAPQTGELAQELAAQVAQINRDVAVTTEALTAKAGERLKQRYPTITRFSQMLTPPVPEQVTTADKPQMVVFPA